MKKLIVLLLSAAMLISLCACGKAAAPAQSLPAEPQETAAPITPEADTAAPEELDYTGQLELIEALRPAWTPEYTYSEWHWCVTDLDRNGRYEVITASLQGTGLYTWADFFEVGEAYNGIDKCVFETEEGGSQADIITDSADCYYDPSNGIYYYIFEDDIRISAAAHYVGRFALSLHDGVIEELFLAGMNAEMDENGGCTITYDGPDGSAISEDEYNNAADLYFAGLEKTEAHFDWTAVDPEPYEDESVIAPVETPDPGYVNPIKITKNPAGECLSVGGKAWFIAHADNADSITWQLNDPQNRMYSLEDAVKALPGVELEALEDDTLAVRNVPAEMNGWSVTARFAKGQDYAVTDPAYVYVGDFLGMYSGVIDSYRSAIAGSLDENDPYGIWTDMDYTNLGYKFKDLDSDGSPELLVGKMNAYISDNIWDKVIYSVFTLKDGKPVNVFTSMARNRYHYSSYGFLNEGSSGASYSDWVIYAFKNGKLEPVESVYTDYINEDTAYFKAAGGDRHSGNGAPVTEEQFWKLVENYESTMISFGVLTAIK